MNAMINIKIIQYHKQCILNFLKNIYKISGKSKTNINIYKNVILTYENFIDIKLLITSIIFYLFVVCHVAFLLRSFLAGTVSTKMEQEI